MRLGLSIGWTSLACLGAVLTVASGCQMPVPEENGSKDNQNNPNQDPSQFQPGTDPSKIPGGASNYGPGGPTAPTPRKLALDLTGVAGFAILDADSQDKAAAASPSTISGGGSSAPSGNTGAMWLESSTTGQVLVRNLDRLGLGRGGKGGALGSLGSPLSGISQEDPGATPTPPAGNGIAPAPTPAPAPSAGGGSVGEQSGLLKITGDGAIVPALVALDPDPAPATATPGMAAPGTAAPGSGSAGATSASSGGGSAGATSASSGGGSAGATSTATGGGSAGATSGDKPPSDTSSGDAAPTAPPPSAGAGGASGNGGGGSATSGPAPMGSPTGPQPQQEPLPRVTALGLSPDGSVYVLFEHGFVFRQPTAEESATQGFDPNSPQSPLRCQLFRADGSWKSGAPGGHDLAQLECVTSEYQVPTWDTRRVMQFDASGKLYFRAVTPANPQGVFLQFDPTTKHLSEKVNANICWRDVQVTPRGSLFYTGSTGTNGDCSGTSFFRYVSADNHLTEIARDWWNFKYLAEQDPADPTNERIIFYGPDPNANTSGGYNWDSACLYRYNPAIATLADRTQKLVDCYQDGWSYVNGAPQMGPRPPSVPSDVPAYQARCESEGQLFLGGDSVSAISQLEDGTLFVVGKFQRKLAGTLSCGVDVSADHCALLGTGSPSDALDPVNTTQQACLDAGHHWMSSTQGCSNPVYQAPDTCMSNGGIWNPGGPGSRHYQMTGAACSVAGAGITLSQLDCSAPGQGAFSEEVNGLAYLVPATDSVPSHLQLLSDPTEHVERYWAVPGASGAQLFYSVYSGGQYNLRMATQVAGEAGAVTIERRALLDDYEVYNLQRDPSHPNRVLFDALQFSTNSYLFGSIDPSQSTPEAVQASLDVVDGVSGKVETLIVLPNF